MQGKDKYHRSNINLRVETEKNMLEVYKVYSIAYFPFFFFFLCNKTLTFVKSKQKSLDVFMSYAVLSCMFEIFPFKNMLSLYTKNGFEFIDF